MATDSNLTRAQMIAKLPASKRALVAKLSTKQLATLLEVLAPEEERHYGHMTFTPPKAAR